MQQGPSGLHDPEVAHHEAGHAIALWNYGIECSIVMNPSDPNHLGETSVVDRPPTDDPAELEIDMKAAAAGEIARDRYRERPPVSDKMLIMKFNWMLSQPEPPMLRQDFRAFKEAGTARDTELLAANPGAMVGLDSWVQVWRATEQLIRQELWPAVSTLAAEAMVSTETVGYERIVQLATAAMREHGNQRLPGPLAPC